MSNTTPQAAPLGNYPTARVSGNWVFVSGLSARLPDGSIAGVHDVDGHPQADVAIQTRVILEKLKVVLANYGSDIDNCLDITVFLTDMAGFDAFNKVYGEYFRIETGPARTTLAVKALPRSGMAVELKVVSALSASV